MNWMERLNERAELMGKMLNTIGAMNKTPAGPQADAEYRSAALRCLNCSQTEACKSWLAENPDGADKPLQACPNAPLFERWLEN